MTQDESIELAREAGLLVIGTADGGEAVYTWPAGITEEIETFAKLVEARTAAKEREWWKEHIKKDIDTAKKEEREACAKLVEHPFFGDQGKECADAIRARGEA